jgi:hypothetical protein
VGRGDEADEEAALADGRVPDEQDLEGAVVAAGRRRRHALRRRPRADQRSAPDRIVAGGAEQSRGEQPGMAGAGWVGAGRWPNADRNKGREGKGSIDRWRKAKAKRGGGGGRRRVGWTPFSYG